MNRKVNWDNVAEIKDTLISRISFCLKKGDSLVLARFWKMAPLLNFGMS